MAVSAEAIGKLIYKISINDEKHLGVHVPSHRKIMPGQTRDSRTEHGWLVAGDKAEPWSTTGFIESGDQLFAYGPYREGRALSDALHKEEPEQAVARIASFAAAVAAIERQNVALPAMNPDALMVDSEGGFLFFPRPVVNSIRDGQSREQRIESFERYNHPDLKDERNASFFIGVMLYEILAGEFPFSGDTEEELHEKMRRQKVVPPLLGRPEIRPEVSQAIVRALTASESFPLSEWLSFFERWKVDGVLQEISDDERARIEEEAQRRRRKADGGFRRREFFRRNWKVVAIAGAVVIVAGIIIGVTVGKAKKPPLTANMTPEQVVSLFYTSMTKLDAETMQICVTDGAGKAQINEATNLSVVSRERLGYEGTTGFVAAQQWLDQGKPKLPPGQSVYGIADLKITKNSDGAYTVSYQKWAPVQNSVQSASSNQGSATSPAPSRVQGFNMVDKVSLKNLGKYWAIDNITNIDSKQISAPVSVTNMSAKPLSPLQSAAQAGQ